MQNFSTVYDITDGMFYNTMPILYLLRHILSIHLDKSNF